MPIGRQTVGRITADTTAETAGHSGAVVHCGTGDALASSVCPGDAALPRRGRPDRLDRDGSTTAGCGCYGTAMTLSTDDRTSPRSFHHRNTGGGVEGVTPMPAARQGQAGGL